MANWDTEETSRIIANDEGLYDTAARLARRATSTIRLVDMLESELSDSIKAFPYSDIDMSAVDWDEIADEYMED